MTQPNTTTTTEEHAGQKMCRAGAATDHPCWRPATEADLGEDEPTLCDLHMQLRRRGENLDAYLHALEGMRDFLESGPKDPIMREYAAHLHVRSDAL